MKILIAIFLPIIALYLLLFFDRTRRWIFGDRFDGDYSKVANNTYHNNYRPEILWGIFVVSYSLLLSLLFGFVVAGVGFVLSVLFTLLGSQQIEKPRRYVLTLFGDYLATWSPGLHILPPGFSVINRPTFADDKQDLFLDGKSHDFEEPNGRKFQRTPSMIDFLDDSAGIEITLIYRIFNPWMVTFNVDKFLETLMDRVETNVRSVLSVLKLDDALKVKEGAGKLAMSFFLDAESKDKSVEKAVKEWRKIRNFTPYNEETGMWIDDETKNPFLVARKTQLPVKLEAYTLQRWGVEFRQEGLVIQDYILRESTITERERLLAANREVLIADRERQADQLRGRGKGQRIEEIGRILQDTRLAAEFDIAEKMTQSVREAENLNLFAESLTQRAAAALAGFRVGPSGNGKNRSSSE